LGFLTGGAALSLLVFLLATVGLARKGVFLIVGLLAIGAAVRYGRPRKPLPSFSPLPRLWKWFFVVGFSAFTVYYLVTAMEPEYSPDAVAYHLHFVNEYNRAHGFVPISNLFASLSQGIELLFLFAFAFGRHSSAALVHFTFLIVLAFSILSYARRAGYPLAGIWAALLIYTCPVIGKDGTCAYIDVAAGTVLFGVFYLVEIWDSQRKWALLFLIGLVAGFAYAAKYTAFLAVPYAAGFVLWRSRSRKAAAVVVLCSLILITPWVAKNVLWTGDPFSPFFNRLFPNRAVHPSFEADMSHKVKYYGLTSRWKIPWELAMGGYRLGGLIGPAFLLAPLALLSLRHRVGRRLLFAGALFLLPYPLNIGARFVIPALPFFALALALVFAQFPVLLGSLAVLTCIVSWPSVVARYSVMYAWRLEKPSWRAALRIESQDDYLGWDTSYLMVRRIDRLVPARARIFSLSGEQQAYSNRTFLSAWLSAESEVLLDIFQCAAFEDFKPNWMRAFHFASQTLRRVRLVQMAGTDLDNPWSIAEVRLLHQGRELRRTSAWRLNASPNPWDVQMAFDNRLVTRWRSWQAYQPGMFIEVDFGQSSPIDTVQVQSSPDQDGTRIRIDGMDASGHWQTLSSAPVATVLPAIGFLGESAMSEIRARNIQYFALKVDDFGADAVLKDSAAWGLTMLDEVGGGRLYRIDAPVTTLPNRTPSQRATTAPARQLPRTLMDVRPISKMASTPSKTATPSSGM
jgi:hypothetical protein